MSVRRPPDPASQTDTDDSSTTSSQDDISDTVPQVPPSRQDARPGSERVSPRQSTPIVETRPKMSSTSTPESTRRPRMPDTEKKGSDDAGDMTLNAAQALAESTGNDAVLKKLRDAINAKIASNQQRARLTSVISRTSTGSVRRVSSLKEDMFAEQSQSPVLSPSLAAAFESPLQSTSTTSTESVATVKGSAAPTPAASALRTPSYPFPYVPGTPRTWSSSFHRPFTTLSPTVSFNKEPESTPGENVGSGLSTPVASASMFMPSNINAERPDSPYPTPNLYDLVLMLNMDPGIDAWWSAVTGIFREFYSADRLSLALPADAGELENVPWGQKASFAIDGRPRSAYRQIQPKPVEVPLSMQSPRGARPSLRTAALAKAENELSTRTGSARPRLDSRHSYAGFEHPTTPSIASTSSHTLEISTSRPRPLRTKSHAPHLAPRNTSSITIPEPKSGPSPIGSVSDSTLLSISDTDFSTVASDAKGGPYTEVLPVLRALNYETEALLEASAVNRIIDRSKLVVLTRDYTESSTRKSSVRFSEPQDDYDEQTRKLTTALKVSDPGRSSLKSKKLLSAGQPPVSNWPIYEDHEQVPTSPWSQSPAPSPAIQADEERNPFDSMLDEGCFAPPDNTVDYSHAENVEAIGIDKANTVIHIPLIHPRTAPSQNFGARSGLRFFTQDTDEGRASPTKRAPMAIISFSASAVPYPSNLAQSLQMLAPHLATTFDVAQHYTTAISQKDLLQQRRSIGSHSGRDEGLDDLADADIDATTLTSPSDYSGRSRQSPGGSIGINTPGWDHGSTGLSYHSASTPSHDIDSYFDPRKRSHSSASHANVARASSPGPENESLSKETWRKAVEPRSRQSAARSALDTKSRKSHSLLHSYGADFGSTLQSLPSTGNSDTVAAAKQADVNLSVNTSHDMPPPSERLMRTIVDSLPVQIFTATPQTGSLTWVNSKFIVYRGQESEHILKAPWQAIHADDRAEYMEEWQRSLTTGQPFSHKVRLRRFDDAYRWFYVRATPLKDKKQRIVHWAGTFMDIHEQHVAEVHAAKQKETAASETKYRTLANSSPQIVFVVSKNHGLTFCNSQWTLYSGQSEGEALGVGFMDAVHPDDLAKCRIPTFNEDGTLQTDAPITVLSGTVSPRTSTSKGDSDESSESGKTITSAGTEAGNPVARSNMYELANTGILKVSRDKDGRPSYSTEVRLRASDGHYRWHLVRVLLSEAIQHEDGENEETWYGTCTDIDDHKTLEQQLKDAMDAKSRFLSNMSHEIRTPLNGITGMVNFLLDSNLTTEQMEHVNIIRNSTEGLRDLINDILDLSKVEAGMIVLTMEWMHIRTLIEEVNDIMFALAMDKGLELNYAVEDNVPNMIKGDRFRIRQVLLNVVGNAIKFTTTGEIFVHCEAETDSADLKGNEINLRFHVIDTGSGFTEKESELLFKRFSQLNKKSQTGTGLGLAISMQLVELHGGSMTASSVPGKGSTFTFTVKCTMPSEAARPSVTASSSDTTVQFANAALIPTPRPLDEPSQGARFAKAKIFDDKSPTASPSPTIPLTTSTTASSSSSNPSLRTVDSSIDSQRSSMSSMMSELAHRNSTSLNLELPDRIKDGHGRMLTPSMKPHSSDSVLTVTPNNRNLSSPAPHPSIFSILIICPLVHTQSAIKKHIELAIPKTAPHHIATRTTIKDSQDLLLGDNTVRFSHIVLDLPEVESILLLMDQLLNSPAHTSTCIVVITDILQRRAIGQSLRFDFEQLNQDRRVRLVFKPLKPSKMAAVFDSRMETALVDQSQNSAQAVAVTQKQIFDELKTRLGDKDFKILLVEDNKTSQMVLVRFFKRVSIDVECVMDGAQCTDKLFALPAGSFSLILCDLQMPVKDGYQTCKDIRKWERRNKYPNVPIVALSANVLGDVYAQCVEAGFNSYVTKPVDFKELRDALIKFLDPPESERGKGPEFMKMKH